SSRATVSYGLMASTSATHRSTLRQARRSVSVTSIICITLPMTSAMTTRVSGIVLAAGAGTRMGMPKALMTDDDELPWLHTATSLLVAAGCVEVIVVLGAEAEKASALVPVDSRIGIVIAEHWADGISESLKAGLGAVGGEAALVSLIDLPGMPLAVPRRVLGEAVGHGTLRQAVFEGRPGHPVLIGRQHWAPITRMLEGDDGAREYLVQNGVDQVECGDLWNGLDVDRR
ncbi:MAG: nucleotidyltransferase family protein, partial [Microbacteriaceae bacterium]|nr:nucleotidyltransferase family protein [Microbacteriaceae bacterium]